MTKGKILPGASGVTLDAGFFIALEKRDTRAAALMDRAVNGRVLVAVPAGVIGQVWRGGFGAQTNMARVINNPRVEKVVLDAALACEAGMLCAATGTSDVIDASVVLCAQARGHHIATSDPGDMVRLDPGVHLIHM